MGMEWNDDSNRKSQWNGYDSRVVVLWSSTGSRPSRTRCDPSRYWFPWVGHEFPGFFGALDGTLHRSQLLPTIDRAALGLQQGVFGFAERFVSIRRPGFGTGHISKPFVAMTLLGKVKEVLNGESRDRLST